MKLSPMYAALVLAFSLAVPLHSQNATQPIAQTPATQTPANQTPAPAQTPAKNNFSQPLATQAPGAGPDKVWVNNKSKVYHCPTDRYYGRTKDGTYMTEAAAKAAGNHGPNGATCFK